jgi:hypothetical protein
MSLSNLRSAANSRGRRAPSALVAEPRLARGDRTGIHREGDNLGAPATSLGKPSPEGTGEDPIWMSAVGLTAILTAFLWEWPTYVVAALAEAFR